MSRERDELRGNVQGNEMLFMWPTRAKVSDECMIMISASQYNRRFRKYQLGPEALVSALRLALSTRIKAAVRFYSEFSEHYTAHRMQIALEKEHN